MREKRAKYLLLLVTSVVSLLLTVGCVGTGQSPPSRFYMLSSIETPDAPVGNRSDADEIGILLGPFRFPEYLNRLQIVTRTSPNKIELAEFDRWAEPLGNNFIAVLKENLSVLLPNALIVEPPVAKNTNLEFQLVAAISRFDAEPGRQVVLIVRWGFLRVKDERMLMVKKSTYTTPAASSEVEEIVRAQSLIVADFSRDIAAAVQGLYRREHGQ